MVRALTQHVYESLMLDVWPRAAGVVDFGIDTQAHYEALQSAVKRDGVTVEQLDGALGEGPKLTALTGNKVKFTTAYDNLFED